MIKSIRNSAHRGVETKNLKPQTSKSEQRILLKPAIKKHQGKRKDHWCAPRKVKSTSSPEKMISLSSKPAKPKKIRRRKVQKIIKNSKRLSILAQPKSLGKNQTAGIPEPVRKCKIACTSQTKGGTPVCPRETAEGTKVRRPNDLGKNLAMKPRRDSSPIVLPRKIGMKLLSLVTEKLKELTRSKDVRRTRKSKLQ